MRELLRNRKTGIPLLLAVLLPAILFSTVRAVFTPYGQENSEDAFWHAAAGRRSVSEMVSKTFPLTLSVWRDHFADKELVFHFLLKGYCGIKSLFHSEVFPPFNGAAAFFIFLFFIAFVTAAHSLGISPPNVLLASLLCGAFLPNFSYRLLMMRPHVFSMALMMFAVAILGKGPAGRRTCAWMFGLSFLYAWSYSSPHLVCITAFLFGIAYWIHNRWKAFSAFGASVAGVARELLPPRFRWILLALPALIGMYFCLMILIRALEKHGLRAIPPNVMALTLSALFWIGAMCSVSIRPVEYAVPMICLTGFPLLDHLRERGLFRRLSHSGAVWGGVAALIVLCGVYTTQNCVENLKIWCSPSPRELAEALRKHVPAGARVVNIVWSDFPYLSFAAPEYEYAWALDPMFSYAYDPEKTEELGRFGRDGRRRRPGKLAALMDADYAVVVFDTNVVGRFLERSGWRPLYRGKDGWLFRLR